MFDAYIQKNTMNLVNVHRTPPDTRTVLEAKPAHIRHIGAAAVVLSDRTENLLCVANIAGVDAASACGGDHIWGFVV